MPISSEDFRNTLRLFPSGVTVVTISAPATDPEQGEAEIHGLTVSAFASISTDPPLIMVAIDHRHRGYEMMEKAGATFAVNILSDDQIEISNLFAWVKDEDRFAKNSWSTAVTGAPVLDEAMAWLDCIIHKRMVAGTHTIYVGEVQAVNVNVNVVSAEASPLLYWNQSYRQLKTDQS